MAHVSPATLGPVQGASSSAGAARAAVLPWIAFLLLAVAAVVLGGLEEEVAASGFRRIQTNRVSLVPGETWVDPRWESELVSRIARREPLDAADEAGRAELVRELAALSFVAEVGEPEVHWPDGMTVPVRFQNPVACLFVGDGYLAVSADGTVLSGSRRRAAQIGAGWLPVIGARSGERWPLGPGDVLEDEALLDALDIAVSLCVHLGPEDLVTLGRVRIDATEARRTSPESPARASTWKVGARCGSGERRGGRALEACRRASSGGMSRARWSSCAPGSSEPTGSGWTCAGTGPR